jgi:hypothetical protein
VDSAAIQRWRSNSAITDTVAFLPVRNPPGMAARPGNLLVHRGGKPVPFQTAPQWTVSSDGWLAIAYDEPYHVAMVSPDGTQRVGGMLDYEPLEISDEHKVEWCTEEERARPWLMGSRPGGPPSRVQVRRMPCIEPDSWPDVLPPFLGDALAFAPDGNLWIRRTVPAGAPIVFDVVDRNGQRIEQIQFPNGRRLVGFGSGSAYLVDKDDLDLEYLERYEIAIRTAKDSQRE